MNAEILAEYQFCGNFCYLQGRPQLKKTNLFHKKQNIANISFLFPEVHSA